MCLQRGSDERASRRRQDFELDQSESGEEGEEVGEEDGEEEEEGEGEGEGEGEEVVFIHEQAGLIRPVGQREFEVNMLAVESYGLPRLLIPARSPSAPAPVLPVTRQAARASGLCLEARIVDFWSGSVATRAALKSWLLDLGFEVTVTADRAQVGPACGYVAARATNLMFAAGGAFLSADVSDAADESWIYLGNHLLQNGKIDAVFLETQHVYALTQMFRDRDVPDEQVPWDIAVSASAWP